MKKILIDTNVLYYLAGFDENNYVDRNALLSLFQENVLCLSPLSLFEVLQNPNHREQFDAICSAVRECVPSVKIVLNKGIQEYCGQNVAERAFIGSSEDQLKLVRNLSEYAAWIYANTYGDAMAKVVVIIAASLKDPEGKNEPIMAFFSKYLDQLKKAFANLIYHKAHDAYLHYRFNRANRAEMLRRLYNNVFQHFFPLIKDHLFVDEETLSYRLVNPDSFLSDFVRLADEVIDSPASVIKRGGFRARNYVSDENIAALIPNKVARNHWLGRIDALIESPYITDIRNPPIYNEAVKNIVRALLIRDKAAQKTNDLIDAILFEGFFFAPWNDGVPLNAGFLAFDKHLIRLVGRYYGQEVRLYTV